LDNLLQNKRGLVLGVANQKSIAWGIAEACHKQGAKLAFTYLNEAMEKRVRPLAESVNSELILECDVQNDQHLDEVVSQVRDAWGSIDFVVHSVAYAPVEELKGRFINTTRDGFKLALDISAYSLVAVAKRAEGVLNEGGSIITLSYYGAEKVVQNYRLMGVAKAALEASVRELSVDLGEKNIRINAISAGPIKTLAASGISGFKSLLSSFEERAPLKRIITKEDVGKSALYFLSDLSSGVTGETHYVDAGFNVTAL